MCSSDLVSLLTYNKKNHIFIINFLLSLLIVEIVISSRVVAGSIPGQFLPFFEKRQVAYFNKDTKSALDYIKKIDASFFRIEKNYSEFSLNDALIQNYFGTTSYLAFPGQGKKNFYQAFNLSRSLFSNCVKENSRSCISYMNIIIHCRSTDIH